MLHRSKVGKIPVYYWANNVEESAVKQIYNLSNLPFAFHHIAIMPDCHTGYGMPIGGVLATQNVIIPNAIGKDIGCGMCAIKTPWSTDIISTDKLKKILSEIRNVIPTGFKHQDERQCSDEYPLCGREELDDVDYIILRKEYNSTLKQLGTLGGGNHFIEIQKDENNIVWIMIHSGSRNLGAKVADYYDGLAKDLNKKWFTNIPPEYDLASLPVDSEEGICYIKEMNYCVSFALANRKLMMTRIAEIFNKEINYKKIEISEMINVAHNYGRLEHHFEHNVMIHRKGATSARKDEVGIIPGSQGSKSYIVRGLGNPDSFNSCSHGAGRVMSRSKARKELSIETEKKLLEQQGIIHSIRNESDLDEAPSAYKDIDTVMNNQNDLVEIVTTLKPLAVIKG